MNTAHTNSPQAGNSRRRFISSFVLVLVLLIGYTAGWIRRSNASLTQADSPSTCLHLSGFQYISPLLLCNNSSKINAPQLANLNASLTSIIQKATAAHKVTSVSVYYRDLTTGNTVNINPSEKYYPASLNKIPTMVAALKMAEADPTILQQTITTDTTDYNQNLEIEPTKVLTPGKTYTVEQALEYMIEYSDNNAFIAVANFINPSLYSAAFSDLGIPQRTSDAQPADYMTVQNFSDFLRILYNASYLSNELSEKALSLLSQADFNDGLRPGVPSDIQIAHKFGIDTQLSGGSLQQRQLHDCGIVYQPNDNYLLCVMTKSVGSLSDVEGVIQDISHAAYLQ